MNAAETSASSAIADWMALTVVPRSSTTAEIDTFMIDVSTTSTNIAIASRIGQPAVARCLLGRHRDRCFAHRVLPVVRVMSRPPEG